MKSFYAIVLLLMTLVATAACAKDNSREKAIKKLNALTEQLAEVTSDYSEDEWDKLAKQFEEVSKEIEANKDKFTPEQKREIDNLRAKCIGLFTAKAMVKASEAIGVAAEAFGGFMEGFLSGLGSINEEAVSQSLSGAFEAMGSALEKSAKDIEKNMGGVEEKMEQMGENLDVIGERLGASLEAIGKSLEAIGETLDKTEGKRGTTDI